jgi:hypothetical protein
MDRLVSPVHQHDSLQFLQSLFSTSLSATVRRASKTYEGHREGSTHFPQRFLSFLVKVIFCNIEGETRDKWEFSIDENIEIKSCTFINQKIFAEF